MHRYLLAAAIALVVAAPAHADYWKLSGPPVFVDDVNGSKAYYVGETRPSNAAEQGGSIQLAGRSITSADFVSISVRYGTHRMHFFWDAPPEILHPGDKIAPRIGWSIAEKWNRFSPGMMAFSHLDWSDDRYIRSLKYGYGDGDADASGFDKLAFTATSNDPVNLVYYTHVACAEGWVRVKWTYTKIAEGAPSGGTSQATASPWNYAGGWTSGDWSNLTLKTGQSGETEGTYDFRSGRVFGKIDGNTFAGYWAQATSDRRCATERYGTGYWGRFKFQMDASGRSWSGVWSYCDDPEGSGGLANGRR